MCTQTGSRIDSHEMVWVIEASTGMWYVSAIVISDISKILDRFWLFRPRWIKFVSLVGQPVWIKSKDVESLWAASADQMKRVRDIEKQVNAISWED